MQSNPDNKKLLAHITSKDWFHPSSSNSLSLSPLPLLVFFSVSWQRAMSLVSPLLGSDYSVDCSASTCYCLLCGDMFRRAVFSATLPGRDGLAQWSFLEYQCLLIFFYLFFSDRFSIWNMCPALWHLPENKTDLSRCSMHDAEQTTANATLAYDEALWS